MVDSPEILSITTKILSIRPVTLGMRETYQCQIQVVATWSDGYQTVTVENNLMSGDTLQANLYHPKLPESR
jgi:urease gamma subunit